MSKKPLTPDKKEECLRLKALFNSRKSELGLTQEKLAHALEMNQSSVSHYLNGVNPLNAAVAASFARILGVDVSAFSERLAEEIARMTTGVTAPRRDLSNAVFLGPIDVWDDDTPLDDDEVYVPFLKEVELSAGGGRSTVQISPKQKLRFGKITLRRQGVQPSEAVCVTVSGNSMQPVLPDGSTVGVDKGNTSITDGKMYALNHGGQLRVKTLYRLPGGGIRMRSFNRDEHPDEEYTVTEMAESGIEILGRVFWSSVLW
jgi:phage repressor protein C with HTH and peptisase S24 domain